MTNIRQMFESFRAEFDHLLLQQLDSTTDNLAESAAQYSLAAGGKRIRPFLVKAAADAVGGAKPGAWIWPSMAVEMIHTYSLIHDDLPAMDDDDLRRGLPTCHKQYGEAMAILAGDGLQMKAIQLISGAPDHLLTYQQKLKQIDILTSASGFQGMVGGQALDMMAENQQADADQLTRIHRMKTGELIAASVVLGCSCGVDVSQERLKLSGQFGATLGLLFQVVDDILDVQGDVQLMGKKGGMDQAHNKSTFPLLLGLSGARQYAEQLCDQACSQVKSWAEQSDDLIAVTEFVLNRNH